MSAGIRMEWRLFRFDASCCRWNLNLESGEDWNRFYIWEMFRLCTDGRSSSLVFRCVVVVLAMYSLACLVSCLVLHRDWMSMDDWQFQVSWQRCNGNCGVDALRSTGRWVANALYNTACNDMQEVIYIRCHCYWYYTVTRLDFVTYLFPR